MRGLVVISEMNSARTLRDCLESLTNQDYRDYRIVVVDGGSSDGSIEIASSFFPEVTLIVVPGVSEVEGQRIAIQSFHSDFILFTNSDCYVAEDWVSRRMAWHERGYDMVGGKLFWGGDIYGFSWSYITPKHASNRLSEGCSLGFSNCSITRDLYERVGGLRDIKCQHDMDFFVRAVAFHRAKIILDPEIEVYHDHPFASLSGSFMRAFCYGFNHILIMRTILGPRWTSFLKSEFFKDPYLKQTILDVIGVHGVRVYRQQYRKAISNGIHINLLKFILVRQVGSWFATKLGWLAGMLVRNPSPELLLDVRRKSRT